MDKPEIQSISNTLNTPLSPPLHSGSTLAVIAPASPPRNLQWLERGIAHLESLGFRVETGDVSPTPRGYLASPDADRLHLFNSFLRRPDVAAIFCSRGGYGSLRLLADLDYDAARRHPKLLVGYSDITALQLALYHKAGWRGLSGPLVAAEWGILSPETEAAFWHLAQGGIPQPLLGPHGETLQPYRPGQAEGILLGGNLATLVRLLGTPYLPPMEGALLFLEEVGEMPYRLDALLAQLKLSGILDRLGGVVVGTITGWEPPDARPTLTPEEVIADYFGKAPYPVATGLVYGHFPEKSTLPIGVRARLEVHEGQAQLFILEPVAG